MDAKTKCAVVRFGWAVTVCDCVYLYVCLFKLFLVARETSSSILCNGLCGTQFY